MVGRASEDVGEAPAAEGGGDFGVDALCGADGGVEGAATGEGGDKGCAGLSWGVMISGDK